MRERTVGVFPGRIDPRALPDLTRRSYSAYRIAGLVAGTFVVAGLAWVFLTDVVLYAISHDQTFIARVETAKGWIFIGLTGVLLYGVTFLSAARLDRVRRLTAATVESIGDGILLLGHDRTVAYANPAAARMLGCTREELVGMSAATFSLRFRVSYPGGGMVPPGRFASQRVFEEGGPLHYKAVVHPTGGAEVVIRSMASASHGGGRAGHLGRQRHARHHRQRTPGAHARPVFAAAAHSLKTPLAIIKADVQALHPAESPAQRRVAASIVRQCDRWTAWSRTCWSWRGRASRAGAAPERDGAASPHRAHLGRKRLVHRHIVQTDVTGSPSLHADPERIALAIRNLLYEASRLSPADSCLTLLARPEGDQSRSASATSPSPGAIRSKRRTANMTTSASGARWREIVEGHGGSLSEEASESERTSWMHLPGDAGAHA